MEKAGPPVVGTGLTDTAKVWNLAELDRCRTRCGSDDHRRCLVDYTVRSLDQFGEFDDSDLGGRYGTGYYRIDPKG